MPYKYLEIVNLAFLFQPESKYVYWDGVFVDSNGCIADDSEMLGRCRRYPQIRYRLTFHNDRVTVQRFVKEIEAMKQVFVSLDEAIKTIEQYESWRP